MAIVGWWRETAVGSEAKEPDWDQVFDTPEERRERLNAAIAEQHRRRAEFAKRGPGRVVESTFKKSGRR